MVLSSGPIKPSCYSNFHNAHRRISALEALRDALYKYSTTTTTTTATTVDSRITDAVIISFGTFISADECCMVVCCMYHHPPQTDRERERERERE